ncbi:MAG: SRPBCC family protein [Planctomycetota bacterium]
MFVHDRRLQHLLRPIHYHDPAHYRREVDALFRPSWQFVCTHTEIGRPGDFQTMDLFDVPILIRNFDGKVRGFENICPHRHSMLTCQAAGNSPVLKCQYHGWHFREDGRTGKIPEPKAFRPWDRENAHLNPIRVERCGDLWFATLDPHAVSLREFLDPFFDRIASGFNAQEWQMKEAWEFDVPCNWKVVIENTLESYHVAEVHPTWMGGQLPAEEQSEHELSERYTKLTFRNFPDAKELAVTACRHLGGQPIEGYWHWHVHPNLVFVFTDTFNYFATTLPTGPTTGRLRTRMYPLWPATRNPWKCLVRRISFRTGRKLMKAIFNEDRSVFPGQQRGITRSRHRGVIGVREERIFQFQKYVCQKTGIPPEAHPADADPVDTPAVREAETSA